MGAFAGPGFGPGINRPAVVLGFKPAEAGGLPRSGAAGRRLLHMLSESEVTVLIQPAISASVDVDVYYSG